MLCATGREKLKNWPTGGTLWGRWHATMSMLDFLLIPMHTKDQGILGVQGWGEGASTLRGGGEAKIGKDLEGGGGGRSSRKSDG